MIGAGKIRTLIAINLKGQHEKKHSCSVGSGSAADDTVFVWVPILIGGSLVRLDRSQRDDPIAISRLVLLKLREVIMTGFPFFDCMRFFTVGNFKGTTSTILYNIKLLIGKWTQRGGERGNEPHGPRLIEHHLPPLAPATHDQ
jgi:hypothetical protein